MLGFTVAWWLFASLTAAWWVFARLTAAWWVFARLTAAWWVYLVCLRSPGRGSPWAPPRRWLPTFAGSMQACCVAVETLQGDETLTDWATDWLTHQPHPFPVALPYLCSVKKNKYLVLILLTFYTHIPTHPFSFILNTNTHNHSSTCVSPVSLSDSSSDWRMMEGEK